MFKFVYLGAVLSLGACAQISPQSGVEVSDFDVLIATLETADIVILGETHDNPHHHKLQVDIVRALQPNVVAFEMVPRIHEDMINTWRTSHGSLSDLKIKLDWEHSGWPAWEMYAPLFTASPDAYLAGGGVSKSDISIAMKQGANAVGSKDYDFSIYGDLSASIRSEMVADLIASHCNAIPESVADMMVDGQRVRDAAFGVAAVRGLENALAENGQAVLIAGTGHARKDLGVPAYLKRSHPNLRVVSLGLREAGSEVPDVKLYDLTWVTPAHERDDPCEGFSLKAQ